MTPTGGTMARRRRNRHQQSGKRNYSSVVTNRRLLAPLTWSTIPPGRSRSLRAYEAPPLHYQPLRLSSVKRGRGHARGALAPTSTARERRVNQWDFQVPRRIEISNPAIGVCVKRQQRKEVIFANGYSGNTRKRRYNRYTSESGVKC